MKNILIDHVTLFVGANQQKNTCDVTQNAQVQITNGEIVYAGARDDAPFFAADETIDGKGNILMPGLCDAHTHNAMTLLRGVGSDLPLDRWLNEAIFPREKKLTPDIVRVGNQLAMMELMRFGVTGFADMYFFADEIYENTVEAGMRALVCDPCVDFGNGGEQLDSTLAFYQRHPYHEGDLVRATLALHAEYTSTPKLVHDLTEAADKYHSRVHVHVSETKNEEDGCIERHQKTPVRYLHDMGLFSLPTLAAHCVYVNDEDIDILASDKVCVSHNPVGNLKLASGVAPVIKMLQKGVSVALGTDGVASNNDLNLWEEIKLMSILHKGVMHDPTVISPAQVLAAATVEGAKGMGFEKVGRIEKGWRADMILLNCHVPHMTPMRDVPSALVYSAQGSDVYMTMVNGKVLYKNGEYMTIDAEKVLSEAKTVSQLL